MHDVHADCRYSYTHTSVTYVLWNTSNLCAITIGKDRYDMYGRPAESDFVHIL